MVKVQLFGGPADGTVIDADSERACNDTLQWAHTANPPPASMRIGPMPIPPTPVPNEIHTYKWDGTYTRDQHLRFVLVLSSN